MIAKVKGGWNFSNSSQPPESHCLCCPQYSFHHCCKKLLRQEAGEQTLQKHAAPAVTGLHLHPTTCLPPHSTYFQILASHEGIWLIELKSHLKPYKALLQRTLKIKCSALQTPHYRKIYLKEAGMVIKQASHTQYVLQWVNSSLLFKHNKWLFSHKGWEEHWFSGKVVFPLYKKYMFTVEKGENKQAQVRER